MLYRVNGLIFCMLLAVALTAGTCGDDGDDANGDNDFPDGGQQGVSGREFISVSVSENGADRALVDGTIISMRFYDDNRVNVSAGCNSISGNYEIADGILQMDMMGMTEMGCDPDRHAQDEWISDVLSANPAITLTGDELVLEVTLDDGTMVRLELLDEEVAIPDVSLTGTLWTVDTLFDEMAASNASWENPATITFSEDGTLSFFDGCNSGSGTYSVTGTTITFGEDMLSTTMACEEELTTMLESHVGQVLTGEVTFEIDQDHLTLMKDDVGLGLAGEPL